jgi:chemotaxis methyl-accepting protein methylase
VSGEREPEFVALLEQIRRARGLVCDAYKPSCLKRRIAVRMRARGLHTYDAYATLLDTDAEEFDRLLDALTINVTKFYRNAETWNVLRRDVLPPLWADRGGVLNCWSAGCASGEEPYTLAMVASEVAARRGEPSDGIRVDATDLDRMSLERARAGTYRPAAFEELPGDLLTRYTEGEDPRAVSERIRRLVRFAEHDLLRDPPPAAPYDVIVCRNVVIYLDRSTQERLFLRLADALAPGGYLVLGRVETLVGDARERLHLENARERVYRR